MKNANIDHLLLMMIAAGWPRNHILDLLDAISRSHPYDLEDKVDAAIKARENMHSNTNSKWGRVRINDSIPVISSSHHAPSTRKYIDEHSDLYIKIKSMLAHDLGLSTDEIVSLLSRRLGSDAYVPPLSKKSLANWLDRLSAYFTPSEILHAATLLREEYKKNKKLDWGVRSDK